MAAARALPALLLLLLAAGVALRGGVTPLTAALLHTGAALLGLLAAFSRRPPAATPAALGLTLGWVGLAGVSTLWSGHRDATLDATGAAAAGGLLFLLGAGLSERKLRRRFALGFALLGAAVAGVALAHAGAGERASFPFGNPNHLASWLLLPAAVACVATVSLDVAQRGRREDALLGFGLVAVTGAAIAASDSLGAALAAFAALLCLGVLRRLGPQRGIPVAIAGLGTLAGLLFVLPLLAPVWVPAASGGSESSPGLRWAVWSASARAALASAPLGAGLGAFPEAFALQRPEGLAYTPPQAHSEPIQGLVELGLPFALLLIVTAVVASRRFAARLASAPSTFRLGAVTALAALAAHSLVDFPLHVPAIALAGATLAGALWGSAPLRPARAPSVRATRAAFAALSVVGLALSASQAVATLAAREAARRSGIGAFEAAQRAAELGLLARPGNAALHAERARAAEHAYRFAGAGRERLAQSLEAWRSAVDASPADPQLRVARARALARAGEHAQALSELSVAVRLDPRSPVPHVAMARLHLDAGEDAAAAAALRRAVERHPRALESAATLLLRVTGQPEAVRALPPDVSSERTVAAVLAQAGYARSAAEAYLRVLVESPADAELALRAARQLERAGDPDAAVAVLRRALAHAPEDPGLRGDLTRLRGGRPEVAPPPHASRAG